jgi:hypothetical protein
MQLRRMRHYSLLFAKRITVFALWGSVAVYLFRHTPAVIALFLAFWFGVLLLYVFQSVFWPKHKIDNSPRPPDPTREELREAIARERKYEADVAAHNARWEAQVESYERSLESYAARILKEHGMQDKVAIDGASLTLMSLPISGAHMKVTTELGGGACALTLAEACERLKRSEPRYRDREFGLREAFKLQQFSHVGFYPLNQSIWRVGEIEFSLHRGGYD